MNAAVRDMTLSDVDEVLSIEQNAHVYPWTRGNFTDALASGYQCKVYDADGLTLGYAVFMAAVDEAHLLNITIASQYQHKGLGMKLLHEIISTARSQQMLRLIIEVRPSNLAALALYCKAGFVELGRRRDYYPVADNQREDAIVMERRL